QAVHAWGAVAIVPPFACANPGAPLDGPSLGAVVPGLPVGEGLGPGLGKPIGTPRAGAPFAATGTVRRPGGRERNARRGRVLLRATGKVRWPDGMDLKAMLGVGLLCGIGFTMSLFIASLAYTGLFYEEAVLGILGASVVASVLGLAWLRLVLPARPGAPD